MTTKTLLALPGDGVGPEIMAEARRVLDVAGAKHGVRFEIAEDAVGGTAYDRYGQPLADETLARCREVDAVLLGAVGGPKWDGVERHLRPEAGLLRLRKELELFANLRPAQCRPALAAASSLKLELVEGLDIMIVRELTSGVYFGEPRGIETLPDGSRRAVDTQVYTEDEIKRVCAVAFDIAQKRDGRLCSVEKANVMETGVLWREVATAMAADHPSVELSHMYADNCAMQMVRTPKQFDVIVTDNLFGDVLSDCAAMLTGSLGMLPSASLGAKDASGKALGVYEPVHGSAPDIAGQNRANPCAMILSAAMACQYSLDLPEVASAIENAVNTALDHGARTAEIAGPNETALTTREMGDAVVEALG